MPSETHQMLYGRLCDAAKRVEAALGEEDPRMLAALAEEHRQVTAELAGAGAVCDAGLLHLIEKTRARVEKAASKIRRQRDELGRQLVAAKKKRAASDAYGRRSGMPAADRGPAMRSKTG